MGSGRLAVISCLLLTLAVFAADVEGEDGSCLFQKNLALSQHELLAQEEERAAKSCTCLSFHEAYAEYGVKCGQGYEFWIMSKNEKPVAKDDKFLELMSSPQQQVTYDEYCTKFYMSMRENYCPSVRMERDPDATGLAAASWCYVSAECQEASPVPDSKAALRTCDEGKDVLMKTMTPAKLLTYAQDNNLNLLTTFQHAYQYFDRSAKAKEVGNFNMGATAEDQKKQEEETALRVKQAEDLLASAKAPSLLYPSADHMQKKWIAYGTQRWNLMFDLDVYMGTPMDLLPTSHTFFAMCMEGCSGEAASFYENQPGHASPWGVKPVTANSPQSFAAIKSETSVADTCKCLPWKDVYGSERVECGQGLEFAALDPATTYDISKPFGAKDAGFQALQAKSKEGNPVGKDNTPTDKFCQGFFGRIQADVCVNQQFQATTEVADKGQWCYVSKECQNLHGGAVVPGTDLSTKVCQKGEDLRLRDMKPSELVPFALNHGVEASMLMGYAYRTTNEDASALSQDRIQKMQASGEPTHVTSLSTPFATHKVIRGDEVYHMNYRKFLTQNPIGLSMIRRKHHMETYRESKAPPLPLTTYKEQLAKME
eukprot:gnl/TRDRNA2_/TRDRNA2_163970_c0_seq2.p1 gnl/TRDRNA2_/TRDRNA2_163970_c0~~gnl/TRDRNA2_/TRDRNA2_163970_c0_seq2.p1  ORF type:complete len:597 (-),score=143.71 gnl/TRDRNA2_/TRDRNA2_163970_c0_seq2:104-1894(-)